MKNTYNRYNHKNNKKENNKDIKEEKTTEDDTEKEEKSSPVIPVVIVTSSVVIIGGVAIARYLTTKNKKTGESKTFEYNPESGEYENGNTILNTSNIEEVNKQAESDRKWIESEREKIKNGDTLQDRENRKMQEELNQKTKEVEREIYIDKVAGQLKIEAVSYILESFKPVELMSTLCGAEFTIATDEQINAEVLTVHLDGGNLDFYRPLGEGEVWDALLEHGKGLYNELLLVKILDDDCEGKKYNIPSFRKQ